MIHVDHFSCQPTQRGRSKIVEEPQAPKYEVGEALVLLGSAEKGDESNIENVCSKAAAEVLDHATQLKVKTIVIHPFAHLFGELSTPEVAVEAFSTLEEKLSKVGFTVLRTPFGWFNTLSIKAKGHPLSRVARIITPDT